MTQKIEDADVLEAFVTVAQKHIDAVTAIYRRGFPSVMVGGAGLLPGGKAGLRELVRIADVSRKAIVRVKGRVATMLKGAGEDSLAIDIGVFVDRIANGAALVRRDENSPVAVVFEPMVGCDGTDWTAANGMWQRLKSRLSNAAAELRTAKPQAEAGTPAETAGPVCPVILGDIDKLPTVFGKTQKAILSDREYSIVRELIRVWPGRLSLSEIEHESGRSEPSKVLSKLKKTSPEWGRAISMAGTPGRGYGLTVNP